MKGEIAVRYTIRHFDLPLLTFEANMDSADTDLHIIKVYEENRSFLPLNLTVSEDGVERWLRHRTIPKNRAYVDALLSKVGLSLNRPLGIIAANKGLSLNDCFWVDAEGSGDTFEKVNLYDNRFSQVLAAIALQDMAAAYELRLHPARSSRPTGCCQNAGADKTEKSIFIKVARQGSVIWDLNRTRKCMLIKLHR